MVNYKIKDKFDRSSSAWNKFIQTSANKLKKNNYDLFLKANDKLAVKEWILDDLNIGGDYVLPAMYVHKNFEEVVAQTQASRYWLKCNLFSGLNAKVIDGNYIIGRSTETTDKTGFENLKTSIINLCKRDSFSMYDYDKGGVPLFFSEKELQNIVDYKHFFVYGEHFFTQTVYNIEKGTEYVEECMVWTDGSLVGAQLVNSATRNFVIPKNWKEQIDVASKIAKHFDFIRIDVLSDEKSKEFYIAEIDTLPRRGNYKAKAIHDIIEPILLKRFDIS